MRSDCTWHQLPEVSWTGKKNAYCLPEWEERYEPIFSPAGAFIPGVPVQPVLLRYPNKLVCIAALKFQPTQIQKNNIAIELHYHALVIH